MVFELIRGVSLLLALCMLQSFNLRLWQKHPRAQSISSGLLYGGVCCLGMLMPITLTPGVIFDARSVILSLAALFGGPLVAVIAATLAAGCRIWLGGTGLSIGLLVIGLSALLGLAYRALHSQGRVQIGSFQLLLFGGLVNGLVVLLLLQLPSALAQQIAQHVAWPYWLIFSCATVLLGWMLQDLTNLTRTQAALQRSESRLRAIAGAIPDLLFAVDETGRYMEVLSSENHLLYVQSSELLGKRMHDILPAADADRFLELVEKTLTSQQPQRLEYSLDTLSGTRYFEGRAQALPHPVDGHRAVVFLARDITEAKLKRDAMAELTRMTTEQNRRLKQFTYIVSHQIRSHVANLLGLTQILNLPDVDQRSQLWEMLCESVQRLDTVICHLNTVTQIHNQPVPAQQQRLLPEIKKCLADLGPELARSTAQIELDVPPELEIWAAPAYLSTVLLELLSNALKYAAPERRPHVRISAKETPGQTVLTICDNGLGMDLDKIGDKLFGMYQTFHGHPDARGLGLFLVQAQLEAMEGSLEVHSQVNQGSTFVLRFKRPRPTAPAPPTLD
ncbi:MAG: sensor histidine kinase [Candidatus Sericytochromatia bacterium]